MCLRTLSVKGNKKESIQKFVFNNCPVCKKHGLRVSVRIKRSIEEYQNYHFVQIRDSLTEFTALAEESIDCDW